MRRLVSSLVLVAACSVPDKQPATGGSPDAGTPTGDPETTITAGPDEFSNSGTVTFEFESNRPDARFVCSLDGEPPAACTSPLVRNLGDGTHSFSVRAVSPTGESDDTPAEHLWSIDTVAPITTLTEGPPANDNSTMVRFAFMSNEMFASFECSLDGAPFVMCRTNQEFGPIGDGAHSFSVRAVDRAGNIDASPAVHTWIVDTSTPDTTIVSGPLGASTSQTATFTFLSPDAGPGATFECSLDGSAFAACASPVEYGALAMGVHTFAVRVRDANGNYDPTPATRTWLIDATPPETMMMGAPSGTVSMASANIAFTASESEVTYVCSLDGAAPAPCTSPFIATGLAQGAHSFSVAATDVAGNTDPSPATASWTVDTIAPDLMITGGPAEGTATGPRVTFTFTASEGTVECRLSGGAWMPCSGAFSFNHPAGNTTFELRSTDGAANQTSISRSFVVDCQPPDATGAIGLLHLDDNGQILVNTAGGANAILGVTDQPEPTDPSFASARFGLGLEFNPAELDVVTWPATFGAANALTVELWSRPEALTGTRDVFVSGDSRIALRVSLSSATTVVYTVTVIGANGVLHSVSSAPYAAGTWHQVVVSINEPALQLYVDGDLTTVGDTRGVSASLDSIRLGGTYGGGLDEVWVAQSTTSQAAVLDRYCPLMTIRY